MKTPPVVLYLGPEEGEKLSAIRSIRESLSSDGDVEQHVLYAFETDPDQVVSLLRNESLFSSHTLIRYRNAEVLKKKDDVNRLATYIREPNRNATLILESNEIRVNKTIESAVGSANKRIFWEMFDNQKEGWVQGYVQRRGASIEPEAVDLLLDLVDNNTLELRSELDRLLAFDGPLISAAAVDRYIAHAKQESVFSLFDAIAAGDTQHALTILRKLCASEEVGRIVAGLSWQIDRLQAIHRIAREKGSRSAAFSAPGVSVRSKRAQRTYTAALDRYDEATVRRAVVLVNSTEELLRSVPAPLHQGVVQSLMYSLMVRQARWLPGESAAPFTYSAMYS